MGAPLRQPPGWAHCIAGTVAAIALGIGFAAQPAVGVAEDAPLPTLAIDPGSVTVSGVSSGAYLAHYLHVIHSESIDGAGLVAGGPYDCPHGAYPWNLYRIFNVCANLDDLIPFGGPPDPAPSIQAARGHAETGAIDGPRNLAEDPVLFISGSLDAVVPTSLVETAATFYRAFAATDRVAVRVVDGANHAMLTVDAGNACDTTMSPFINDCDVDAAGAILGHLYGDLIEPDAGADDPGGTLVAFDQSAFVADAGSGHGLGERGFLYMPDACAGGANCRLHVALHGCRQTPEDIGEAFVRDAGYNRWADANRIVILYPQAKAVTRRFLGMTVPWPNPRGCWDWWGFTGDDYAVRTGVQPRAIMAMINRITGRPDQ